MIRFHAAICWAVILLGIAIFECADARPRGVASSSSFGGGKIAVNTNFSAIGGDYPFVNFLKSMATPSVFGDNTGFATPDDVDANGYLKPGSNAESHGGLYQIVRIPAAAFNGSNYVIRVTGKGTVTTFGTIVTTTACSISTGASTVVNCTPGGGPFSGAQDFRSGMEVPISGTTGVTVTNGPGGSITANVYTVCPGYVVGADAFTLCLNDQLTPVQTTGTPSGTTTISYGRRAIGVSAQGRVIVSISGSPVSISPVGIVSQNASTPISDMALITQGSEEVRYERGCLDCIFGAKFLATLRSGNVGVLRSLDLINQNSSLEVNWADRKPESYISYASDIFDRSPSVYASGGTTNSGNDYALSFGSGAPTDRQQILLKFNASSTVSAATVSFSNGSKTVGWTANGLSLGDPVACTDPPSPGYRAANYYVTVANTNSVELGFTAGGGTSNSISWGAAASTSCVRQPTLNLNGTGAIPIKDQFAGGVVLNSSTRQISAGVMGTLTYDAVLNAWLKYGADVSGGNQYFTSGWPPETVLRLSSAILAHPWFIPPRFVVDGTGGISNYMPSLAAYVKANQQSWMVPRFEVWNNELWNNVFPATAIGTGHAKVYANSANPTGAYAGWTTGDLANFAGKVGSVIGQAVNQAYGGSVDGVRYQTVGGIQAGAFTGTSGASSNAARMTSASYVAQTPAAQSGYTKSPASDWTTHIALAQYLRPGYYLTGTEATLAAAWGGGWLTGSISVNQLTVSSVTVGSNPVPIGTIITGPGIPAGTTVASGTSSPYTLDRTLTNPVGSTAMSTVSPSADSTAPQTFIDSLQFTATFTGSISGTTLTTSSVVGTIGAGNMVFGSGVEADTNIVSGSGPTYTVSRSQTVASTSMQAAGSSSVPVFNVAYQNIAAFAGSYQTKDGVNLKCNGYEGGYDAIYSSNGASSLDQLRYAGKITTSTPGAALGIRTYVAQTLTDFKNAGCEFPALFQATGITPSNNSWSALEDIYQTTPSPVWDAYINFNFLLKRDIDPAANENSPMWLEKAA